MKKRILAFIATTVILITSIWSEAIIAKAYGSQSTLGTKMAIGSPILNSEFSAEDWDKYEMVVFGIYLSNFCVPLVDTYESAFSTSASYGTKGSGLEALEFGSGNDPANNEVIKELLTQAINYQKSNQQQKIYVGYTRIEDGEIKDTVDPNSDSSVVREANFNDLFLLPKEPSENSDKVSWADSNDSITMKMFEVYMNDSKSYDNYKLSIVGNANLPTFYVKSSQGKYVKVFDLCDSWDIQVLAAMVNSASNKSTDYSETFYKNYSKMYGKAEDGSESCRIAFDGFGNIVSQYNSKNYIVIPGSTNRHLSKDNSINILNSWVMNGTTTKINSDMVVNKGRQVAFGDNSFILSDYLSQTKINNGVSVGGLPAFNSTHKESKLTNGTVIIYKDSDSLIYSNGETTVSKLLEETMDKASIDNTSIPLKIETVNEENLTYKRKEDSSGAFGNTVALSYMLSNQLKGKYDVGLDYILEPTGDKIDMFQGTALVSNQMKSSSNNKSAKYITRQLTNYMYEVWKQGTRETPYGKITKNKIKKKLEACETDNDIAGVYKWLFKYFKSETSDYADVKYKPTGKLFEIDDDASCARRFTVVQLPSDVLSSCANTLGQKSGTEFSLYSTYIYVTYLDYYGINSGTKLGESGGNTTKLNTELFGNSNTLSINIDEISSTMTKEDKEKAVIDMSYLVLSTSKEGEEYRKELSESNVSSFLSSQYQKMIYKSKSSASIDSGFLNVDSLEENPFTSFILDIYSNVAVWILLFIVICIIVLGLIFGKNAGWFFASILVAVNIVVVLPAMSNIAPALSNRMVQNLFKNKSTYWCISSQLETYNKDVEAASVASSADEKEANKLAKQLNIISESNLRVKRDISAKVNTKMSETYKSVQQLTTVRWILPILMNQITGDKGNETSYVYTTLSSMFDNASNMYLYYNDAYKDSIGTISAISETDGKLGEKITAADRVSKYYTGYKNTGKSLSNNNIQYRNIGYYNNSYDNMSHTYFYLLQSENGKATPLCMGADKIVDYGDIDTYNNYIEYAKAKNKTGWISTFSHIEDVADEYDSSDRSTIDSSYGYLWNSESVYNYMYQTVEDSFDKSESVGSLIGKLLGKYEKNDDGVEVRSNFMYADDSVGKPTGYVRDILDLQELFTNNIPYMYNMWLTAGGFDGTSGILGDEKIKNTDSYDGIDASWYFRCNWAIKIMENKDLNRSTTVRDKDGNKYKVDNMLIASCYPSKRPMVFSEAQKKAYGLKDSDLSYVELKCININNSVSRRWTSLVNYAGTSNIKKEVLLRQMALDATFEFNSELNTSAFSNSAKQLYPTSVDMRNLSFDSVMKLIILNITKDSSYVFGSTMDNLLDKTDIVTASLLLLGTFLCNSLIPLSRDITSTILLLLVIISLCISALSSNKFKIKLMTGYCISQFVIFVTNAIYYSIFSLFVVITNTDEILSISSIKSSINTGNPVWVFVIVDIISIAYIVSQLFLIKFFYKNRGDMGFEVYTGILNKVKNGITNTVGYVQSRISGLKNGTTSGMNTFRGKVSDFANSHRGYENNSKEAEAGSIEAYYEKQNDKYREESSISNDYEQAESYNEYSGNKTENTGKNSINSEIEKGEQINKEEIEEDEK